MGSAAWRRWGGVAQVTGREVRLDGSCQAEVLAAISPDPLADLALGRI
ncbi:hypothetical protein [Streptomyces violascens]